MYLHAGQLEDIKLSILQGYKFPIRLYMVRHLQNLPVGNAKTKVEVEISAAAMLSSLKRHPNFDLKKYKWKNK